MTPEARLAAAAEVLDRYLAGEPAEKVLTNWARRSRFAGSKDRAAVRDHVFDVIRRQRSATALGGGDTGRALVIGLLRATGQDPASLLTGQGHAMGPLTAEEAVLPDPPEGNAGIDCPDWLEPELRRSLGAEFHDVMARMQHRADVFLRVNALRSDRATVREELLQDGIECENVALSETALRVTGGGRRIRASRLYQDGLVEIQDVASQAVSADVPLPEDGHILDYCAGGGGKALALAARGARSIFVHDAEPRRMKDIPERARRAGVVLRGLSTEGVPSQAPFSLVVADVPCSGSGAWRRQPEAKWRLDSEGLARTVALQREILDAAAGLVSPGGRIAYMTCSLLQVENSDQVDWFLARHEGWMRESTRTISPILGGDGFFLAMLCRDE